MAKENIRTYERFDFVAWQESGETALALIDDCYWFNMALNCYRDGDMGEKTTDGIYERAWATDYIDEPDRATVRPMTPDEVAIYRRNVDISREYFCEGHDVVYVLGRESFVLIETNERNED